MTLPLSYINLMQLSSVARINNLIWITSLRENERGVTRRVLEDLVPFTDNIRLQFENHEPQTAGEFLGLLDAIAACAAQGMLPLIHLDMHGNATDGIIIAATGESIGWPTMTDKLRAINVQTGNNLCVVSGACFSFEVARQFDIKKPTPFFMLFAPVDEIPAGLIEENAVGFYRSVFGNEEIIASQENWFPEMECFHCQKSVITILARYIDMAGMGKNADLRKEDLVSMAITAGIASTPDNLRSLRKLAAEQSKPSSDLLERISHVFLIGRSVGCTIDELVDFVREARRSGMPARPYPRSREPEGSKPDPL